MNILRFSFFLPLLLCSVLLSARVVEVKDSVRAEEPVVWSEDFNGINQSAEANIYASNGHDWTLKNGVVSNEQYGMGTPSVVLTTNGNIGSGDEIHNQVASLTTELIYGCIEVQFRLVKSFSARGSNIYFPSVYLATSRDGKLWTQVQNSQLRYKDSNDEQWQEMNWGDWNGSIEYTDVALNRIYSVTFSQMDRYVRWCTRASDNNSVNAKVYIDDIEIVCKPWIYSTHEETVWDYTQSVNVGDLGIVCRDKAIESGNYEGVEFYRVAYRVGMATNPTDLVVEQVENLEAGVPYIYYATATQMSWDESGEAVATAGTSNGLHGTLTGITDGNQLNGKWVFYENKLWQIGDASCTMGANKGYIDMSEVCEQSAATLVPGRKIMSVNRSGSVTTGVNDSKSNLYSSYTHRILRRGNRLVILQGDKMVDMLGNVIR